MTFPIMTGVLYIIPYMLLYYIGQVPQKLTSHQEAEIQAVQSLRGGGALTGNFLSTSCLPAGILTS